MKVLIDTNIVLDIALNRKPFVEHAYLLWRLAEQKDITACISNTSITDIFYICNKHVGNDTARKFIAEILDTFTLVDIDEQNFGIAPEIFGSTVPSMGVCVQNQHPFQVVGLD